VNTSPSGDCLVSAGHNILIGTKLAAGCLFLTPELLRMPDEETNAAKYRRLATNVRHDARLAHDEDARAQLFTIAQSYEKLAVTVELIARRRRSQLEDHAQPGMLDGSRAACCTA
jgi:hypothetical protein